MKYAIGVLVLLGAVTCQVQPGDFFGAKARKFFGRLYNSKKTAQALEEKNQRKARAWHKTTEGKEKKSKQPKYQSLPEED